MLTGQVPFAGDNSVSVALLHIQSEATPVQVINPEVPTSVDRIVQKCMQKKPERRYQSAAELIRDLKRSILNPDGDYVNISSSAAVTNSPTRPMTEDEMETIKSAAKSPVVYFENNNRTVSRQNADHTAENPPKKKGSQASLKPNAKHVQKEVEEIDSMNSTLEKILAIVSIIFAVALVIFIFYFLKKYFFSNTTINENPNNVVTEAPPSPTTSKISLTPTPTPSPTPIPFNPADETFPMPKVLGLTVEDAMNLIKMYSDKVSIDWKNEEYSDEYEKGLVSQQYPGENVTIPKTGNIRLTVSAGKEPVELPDIVNKDFESARMTLAALGLTIVPLHEYSDDVDAGKIIRTEPEAPSMVEKESEVIVYISDGPEIISVPVPKLTGKTVAAASAELSEIGLVLGEATQEYSDKPKGMIISQAVAEGTLIDQGAAIDYTVSIGPLPEPEPDEPEEPDTDEQQDEGTPAG
jgi:serine/threonine-protein kinase